MLKYFKKIKKIIEYIPILWNNEDWDYGFLLDIVEFKIKRMRNNLEEYYIGGNGERIEVRKQIDKTLDAINKYYNSYELFPMADPEELYNVEMFWKKNNDRNTSSICYRFIEGKEVPESHEFFEYQSKYIIRMYKWEQACWNRIWNIIRDNGQKWCD